MRIAFVLLTTVLSFGVRLQAQTRELSVAEAVRLGLSRNDRLRAANADAAAAQATLREVRADLLPALRSQANYTRLSNNIPNVAFTIPGTDSTVTFQAVERNRYQGELTLQQPLFTGARLRNQVGAAQHGVRAAELREQQEAADVAFDIRRAWWNLYRAEAAKTALASARARVDAHLADVEHRVKEGAALRRDLLAAQTRRSEVRLEQVAAENAVRVGQLELNRLIGLPLNTPLQLRDAAPPDTAAIALDSSVVLQRPELQALSEQVAALRAQLRASQGDRWPQLDFVGRYVYARPNPYFFSEQDRFHYSWELGFTTHWSIWEGGRRSAQASELGARVTAASARLAEARTQVLVDAARKALEIQRAKEAVDVAGEGVREAEETFRVARAQYQEGAALATDVLDAEQAFRAADIRAVQARADLQVARAALLNALGRTE